MSTPKSKAFKTVQNIKATVSPYAEFKFDSYAPLELNKERAECPKCKRKRMHYCYNCICAVGNLKDQIPCVNLPLTAHVVKHPKEKASKSTAIQAGVLSPSFVKIHHFPDVPSFKDPEKVLLLFPSDDAVGLGDLKREDFEDVVFIDCTWQQTASILRDGRFESFKKVKISSKRTAFWRYQTNLPDSCLATIEAIYFFFREFHENFGNSEYDGRYDNLLYFFHYQYNMIQKSLLEEESSLRECTKGGHKRKVVEEG